MLRELERKMREGELPDPRTRAGITIYTLIVIAIGIWLGGLHL